jgi:hypothetical protein
VTPDEYCREIEAYLTRKNDGHLVRIVGPSFERVRNWAEQGVPLKVAFAGIDRRFERYYARGPRRRPVHIDHCEPDVLDAFDAWRRAVGVTAGLSIGTNAPEKPRSRDSLATTLERAVARLTTLRAGPAPPVSSEILAGIVAELDPMIAGARTARGPAREALVDRLATLDRRLMDAARAEAGSSLLAELQAQAVADLEAFAERMPAAAWQQAVTSAVDRALRNRLSLPVLAEI